MRFFIILLFLLCFSCKKKEDPQPISRSDRQLALQNIGDYVIIGSFLEFQNAILSLQSVTKSYFVEPKEEIRLLRLQNEWKLSARSWKNAYPFLFAPVDIESISSELFSQADVNAIRSAIDDNSIVVDSAFIARSPGNMRGLRVMEYLIFDIDKTNSEVVKSFTTGNGAKKLAYLEAVVKNMINPAGSLIVKWSKGGEGHVQRFVTADGGDKNSSVSLLLNRMIGTVSIIKEQRLGIPLGVKNNGIPQPDAVEAKFSKYSLPLLIAELRGVESCFSGYSNVSSNTVGLNYLLEADGVKYNNRPLGDEILARFNEIYQLAANTDMPLEKAVEQDRVSVQKIYDRVVEIEALLKNEVTSSLKVKN